jgi:hypothetical protein
MNPKVNTYQEPGRIMQMTAENRKLSITYIKKPYHVFSGVNGHRHGWKIVDNLVPIWAWVICNTLFGLFRMVDCITMK